MGLFFSNRQFSELAVYAAAGIGYVNRIGLAASPDRRGGVQLLQPETPAANPVCQLSGVPVWEKRRLLPEPETPQPVTDGQLSGKL